MNFYRAAPVNAIPAGQGGADGTGAADPAAGLAGDSPLIAIRAADLVAPAAGPWPGVAARRLRWPALPRSVPGISCCS